MRRPNLALAVCVNGLMFAFVVLGLVLSLPSQEIGWEELFRNDLLCVE